MGQGRGSKAGSTTVTSLGVLEMHPRMDGADVLDRLRAGGPVAAALIYDGFGKTIDAMVYRLLGNDSEHDDVVHSVLIAVLASVRTLREAEALPGFVRRITINVVYSELRRRRVRRLWTTLESDPDRFCAASNDVEEKLLFHSLYAVLDRLPAKERLALGLRHFESFSIAELAAALGCSTRTVDRLLARAESRFRRFALLEPALREWLEESSSKKEASR